jgi:hypothetical protein
MLSPSFLDWWFSPWKYASSALEIFPFATDELSKRDAYRLWCCNADVQPALPEKFNAGWCFAESLSTESLMGSAWIFSGLMAARNKDFVKLAHVDVETRKWCLSIASTQPSKSWPQLINSNYEKRFFSLPALFELRIHLDEHFPGLWSRIRLLLPAKYLTLLENFEHDIAKSESTMFSNVRAQRCWQMSLKRYHHNRPITFDTA